MSPKPRANTRAITRAFSSLVVALALAGGCGASAKNTETLTESIRAFNDGVRWQRFSLAANAIPPKERGKFVDEMDQRAEDLRITDYEIVRVDSQGPRVAKVQIKISWYLDSEGTLRETHAVQTWELHGKQWWMVEATRLRGDEMPGLVEPATEPDSTDLPDDAAPAQDGPSGQGPATTGR